MSGIEVIAIVPAVISAFCAIAAEYRVWRIKRKDRAIKDGNISLQHSLSSHGPAVEKHEEDLRRLGAAFSSLDEIGRSALQSHLIILQSTVIYLLRDHLSGASHIVHPHHNSIFDLTDSARHGTITALAEQF